PPTRRRFELEDREVQVRCIRWRVAGRTDAPEYLAASYAASFDETLRVRLEVRVVVGVVPRVVEDVHGETAGHAREELRDRSVVDRDDRRAARRRNVERLVSHVAARIREGVA